MESVPFSVSLALYSSVGSIWSCGWHDPRTAVCVWLMPTTGAGNTRLDAQLARLLLLALSDLSVSYFHTDDPFQSDCNASLPLSLPPSVDLIGVRLHTAHLSETFFILSMFFFHFFLPVAPDAKDLGCLSLGGVWNNQAGGYGIMDEVPGRRR